MKLSELILMPSGNIGVVDLECFFLSKKEITYLVDDVEKMEIKIDATGFGLRESLDGVLSSFGGGQWDYCDKCLIKVQLCKKGNLFFLEEVFLFEIVRSDLKYLMLPVKDIDNIQTNIEDVFLGFQSGAEFQGDIIGYFVLNDDGASINSSVNVTSNENISIKIFMSNIEDIVECNFIPDDKWPDYEAYVKVSGVFEFQNDNAVKLISARRWEVIYPNVTLQFEGAGRCIG